MKTVIIFVAFVGTATIAGALIVVLREHRRIRFILDLFASLVFAFFLVKIVFFSIDQSNWLTIDGWMYLAGLAGAFCGARAAKIDFKKKKKKEIKTLRIM